MKNPSMLKSDKYYIVQEPVANWYMTDEPKGKTPFLYKADSWNSKELAANWLLGNVTKPEDYKIIEVEMTLRYV